MRTSEIRDEITSSGSHYFDRDTMRFFNSKLCGSKHGPMATTESSDGRYSWFVTSERDTYRDGSPRAWSVRRWDRERKTVDTVGVFQEHASEKAARKAMYAAATEYGKLTETESTATAEDNAAQRSAL